MVQTRDLAEYASGRQTRVEIGRQADIGGVRRNVARRGLLQFYSKYMATAAAAERANQ